jgi:2-(3-amino-3-carboxypropyl)histidine synthase
MYDLEEARIIEEIQKRQAKRVLLQLPEGLKKEAARLSNVIQEKTKATVIVSGEPSWGACDLPVDEAKRLSIDLIVHFGHAPFHHPDIPILYIETHYKKDITPLIEKFVSTYSQYHNIGLVTSIQHIHQIPLIRKLLEQHKKTVIIPEGKGRAFHQGQILGCEYTGPKMIESQVDAYLTISNGFHSLGLLLSTEKPVILINPSTELMQDLTPSRAKYIKQRTWFIEKAKEARSFGILISTKSGQINTSLAEQLKNKIVSHKKEATIISMAEIQPQELENFHTVDVFITTACPRLSIEDQPRFSKPILTVKELLVALGEMTWEESLKTGFITAPYGVI